MLLDIAGAGLASVRHFLDTSHLQRFIPEPKGGLGLSFRKILEGVKAAAGKGEGSLGEMPSELSELLAMQMEMQEQMMRISMISNVSRTEHETKMAAVRNMRLA